MARRPKVQEVEWLIGQIDNRLKSFDGELPNLGLREKVLRLVELQHQFSDLGVSVVHTSGLEAGAAIDRIRLYLTQFSGVIVHGDELAVVSGISDYPRRIRQLRVEQGYQIASGASPDSDAGIKLKPDEYLLLTTEPDLDQARRWHIANRIRKSTTLSQDERILEFLKENVGKIVTTEELSYVSRDKKEFGRRTRELRTEQGYLIATKFTGRPDLRPGQYILESLDRREEAHDRKITVETQKIVFARDKNTCVCCQWNRENNPMEGRRFLELHHIQHHKHGGSNEAENLVVLCSRCHDDVHAKRLELTKEGEGVRCSKITH